MQDRMAVPRQCPFGQFWDQNVPTCRTASEVKCDTGQLDTFKFYDRENIFEKKKRKLSDVWNINISSDYVVLDINSCLAFNIHIYPFFPFTIHCENKNTCKCNFFIILSNMKQTPNFIGGLQKKGLMSIKNFFLWTYVQYITVLLIWFFQISAIINNSFLTQWIPGTAGHTGSAICRNPWETVVQWDRGTKNTRAARRMRNVPTLAPGTPSTRVPVIVGQYLETVRSSNSL